MKEYRRHEYEEMGEHGEGCYWDSEDLPHYYDSEGRYSMVHPDTKRRIMEESTSPSFNDIENAWVEQYTELMKSRPSHIPDPAIGINTVDVIPVSELDWQKLLTETAVAGRHGDGEDPRGLWIDKMAKDSGRDVETYITDSGEAAWESDGNIMLFPFPEHLVKKFTDEAFGEAFGFIDEGQVCWLHALYNKAHEFMYNEFWHWDRCASDELGSTQVEAAALIIAGVKTAVRDWLGNILCSRGEY